MISLVRFQCDQDRHDVFSPLRWKCGIAAVLQAAPQRKKPGLAQREEKKKKETWEIFQLLVLFLVKNFFLVTLSCHVLLLLLAKLVDAI